MNAIDPRLVSFHVGSPQRSTAPDHPLQWEIHYLTHEIGRGLFLRADAGPTRFEVDVEGGGLTGSSSSEWRFGALVGAGYGIPVSGSTRILLNHNYAFRKIEGETVGALAITVGGLF